MAASKPTAAAHFPNQTAANKTKIQSTLDDIDNGGDRARALSEASLLGRTMNAVDREQLVNLAYQRLAAR